MNETLRLDEVDRERFMEAVESALTVSNRQQFFVWAQSALQGLIPHEVLICGVEEAPAQGVALHRFASTRYFRQEHFDALCDPLRGLRARLAASATRQRSPVVLWPPEAGGDDVQPELGALIVANELKNLAAHLIDGASGRIEAFYAFGRIAAPLDARLAHKLALATPHLHAAFLRVLAHERDAGDRDGHRAGRLVTPRQEEILQLIKLGQTNAEIALGLGCSPWTVKNHIQAILKKLDSNSRTHAVAKAISLRILLPD